MAYPQTILEIEKRPSEEQSLIGNSSVRIDSVLKVTGRAVFTRDLKLPRMLHARLKRCPLPHAKILTIDTSKVLEMDGVRAIMTGKDFPKPTTEDTPPLAYEEVLYANQAVLAVAAETLSIAENAIERVEIRYEELPAVFDPELAMTVEAPTQISHSGEIVEEPNVGKHVRVIRGNVTEAFARADHVIENTYTTSGESHFQLEPLTFLAQADPDGGVTIWATSSGPHKTQLEVANYLKMDPSLVRREGRFSRRLVWK